NNLRRGENNSAAGGACPPPMARESAFFVGKRVLLEAISKTTLPKLLQNMAIETAAPLEQNHGAAQSPAAKLISDTRPPT
ncbi:MAG TPA: hypothetical protein DCY27_01160, partial [Desulfobacterales bacterium]|nr:hypothetical protein [Desulfobacterales bacterium]